MLESVISNNTFDEWIQYQMRQVPLKTQLKSQKSNFEKIVDKAKQLMHKKPE